MNKVATLDMTEGKVIRVLLVFTIPIFISNLFQQFYNVVDVAVIGHILGDNALAAVGATSSIYSLVIGFINGMSNGFCIIIARYFRFISELYFSYHAVLLCYFCIQSFILNASGYWKQLYSTVCTDYRICFKCNT